MAAWAGAGAAGSLGAEPSPDSGVKVMEKAERPSELTGNEALLASLGLKEEEEVEALLRRSSLVALLWRLSVSRSSRDEFHVLRLCFISCRGATARDALAAMAGVGTAGFGLSSGLLVPAAASSLLGTGGSGCSHQKSAWVAPAGWRSSRLVG